MRQFVIEVLDTAEQITPEKALDILTFAFRGEVLSVQELDTHPIYQAMRAALVSISVNGNELDFDSAECANDALVQVRPTPVAADGAFCACEQPLGDDGYRCIRCGLMLPRRR